MIFLEAEQTGHHGSEKTMLSSSNRLHPYTNHVCGVGRMRDPPKITLSEFMR
jgi:hypothetical protein